MTTFLQAIRTRSTKTTQVLDVIGTNLAAYGAPIAANLAKANALNAVGGHLPAWAEQALNSVSGANPALVALTNQELLHIGGWPDAEKDKVREALYQAIQAGRAVRFYWELYAGANSVSQVDNLAGPGDISITFRSPQSKVKIKGAPSGQPDDVTVDVP